MSSNDALVGYMAGKAVMDKVNGDFHNARENNRAQNEAALANRRAESAKDTTASVVGVVISLKKQLADARENTRSWKRAAFLERTGKLAWIKTIKDLIKYKHLNKSFEEVGAHVDKYYDPNLENNLKLMNVEGSVRLDVKIEGDIPFL